MTKTALAKRRSDAVASTQENATEIDSLIRLALERDVPVEKLERLVALKERVADKAAAAEFNFALSMFQEICPQISKKSTAEITTKSGIKYRYKYADLDHMARTIAEPLKKCGLSYTWDSMVKDTLLTCICTLRHLNGHTSSASFSAPIDMHAKMTDQQKYAVALSYARRQSMVQVLGLTTCEPDTDGGETVQTITDKQAADLKALMQEVKADIPRFLKYMEVKEVGSIKVQDYARAVAALEAKRRAS